MDAGNEAKNLLDLPPDILGKIMSQAMLCKATLRTRFADQKDCIFEIPHNCFFDNKKQQIGDAPLQLQGYRWGKPRDGAHPKITRFQIKEIAPETMTL